MTELLTISDLCEWLKLTEFQVRAMLRKKGQSRMRHPLPSIRLNSNVRFVLEIEESFDPTTEVYVEVRRKAVKKAWVSESSFDSGLYEKMFDVVGDLEAVQARVISATTSGNGCVHPKVLQVLDQILCAKGSVTIARHARHHIPTAISTPPIPA